MYRSSFSAFTIIRPVSARASVFLSLLFRDLILREYVSSLQSDIDLAARWISYLAESNNVPQIPSGFRGIAFVSIDRNLDYSVYCCFAVLLFFFSPFSLFLSLSFSLSSFLFDFSIFTLNLRVSEGRDGVEDRTPIADALSGTGNRLFTISRCFPHRRCSDI